MMNLCSSLPRLLQGLALVMAVMAVMAVVVAVAVLNFVLVHAAPGDPVETIAGVSGSMSKEPQAELRTQYGLDHLTPRQLGRS